jgi:hypothetical protein
MRHENMADAAFDPAPPHDIADFIGDFLEFHPGIRFYVNFMNQGYRQPGIYSISYTLPSLLAIFYENPS